MWLSSAVLLPIGIFLTYVAVVDASLFNTQEYIKIWNIIKRKFGWGSNQTTDDVEKLD
jgi:lipopolysaccharide export system permease protein